MEWICWRVAIASPYRSSLMPSRALFSFFFEAAEGVCMRRLFSFQYLIATSDSGSWQYYWCDAGTVMPKSFGKHNYNRNVLQSK